MDEYQVRPDMLRRKAEPKMQMWGVCPEDTGLGVSSAERHPCPVWKSSAPASARGGLGTFEVARQMRRPLGPRGGADRQDVSAATDVAVTSNDDDDAAWLPHRKAKKREAKSDGAGGVGETEKR